MSTGILRARILVGGPAGETLRGGGHGFAITGYGITSPDFLKVGFRDVNVKAAPPQICYNRNVILRGKGASHYE